MNEIKDMKGMALERHRLIARRFALETQIEQNISQLKKDLSPLNLIREKLGLDSSATGKTNPAILKSGSMLLELLIPGVLMRKSSFLKKIAISIIISKAGPSIVHYLAGRIKNRNDHSNSKNRIL